MANRVADLTNSSFQKISSINGVDTYVGQQHYLVNFLELHAADSRVSKCHLNISSADGDGTISAKYHIHRSYAKFIVIGKQEEWGGNAQNLTLQLFLNDAGRDFLEVNNPTEIVYSVWLRCSGAVHKNVDGASGSNCQKQAFKEGWCSNLGKCSDECTFLAKHSRDCPTRLGKTCNAACKSNAPSKPDCWIMHGFDSVVHY